MDRELFDVDSYDDVREAAEYIGLNPNAVCWDLDDKEIVAKANRKLRKNHQKQPKKNCVKCTNVL